MSGNKEEEEEVIKDDDDVLYVDKRELIIDKLDK